MAWPTLLSIPPMRPARGAWLHAARFGAEVTIDGRTTSGAGKGTGAASQVSGSITRSGGQRASRLDRGMRTSASLPPTTRKCGLFSPDIAVPFPPKTF